MLGWLCHFMRHRWIFIANFDLPSRECNQGRIEVGLYQCTRCKEISLGASRKITPKWMFQTAISSGVREIDAGKTGITANMDDSMKGKYSGSC